MFDTREKRERSLGVRLGLKPERCVGPKCAATRKPYRPGVHAKRRAQTPSEMKLQLREKQIIKATYGIREAAMRRAVKSGNLVAYLEKRLDNVVYRLGFALSRSIGRQLAGHGHILVNGRKVTIPSYQLRVGDVISIRPQSKDHHLFKELNLNFKKIEAPVWLSRDDEKVEGKVISEPKDLSMPIDMNLVIDYYSK